MIIIWREVFNNDINVYCICSTGKKKKKMCWSTKNIWITKKRVLPDMLSYFIHKSAHLIQFCWQRYEMDRNLQPVHGATFFYWIWCNIYLITYCDCLKQFRSLSEASNSNGSLHEQKNKFYSCNFQCKRACKHFC